MFKSLFDYLLLDFILKAPEFYFITFIKIFGVGH